LLFGGLNPLAQQAGYVLLIIASGGGGEGKRVVSSLRRWLLYDDLDGGFCRGRGRLLQI